MEDGWAWSWPTWYGQLGWTNSDGRKPNHNKERESGQSLTCLTFKNAIAGVSQYLGIIFVQIVSSCHMSNPSRPVHDWNWFSCFQCIKFQCQNECDNIVAASNCEVCAGDGGYSLVPWFPSVNIHCSRLGAFRIYTNVPSIANTSTIQNTNDRTSTIQPLHESFAVPRKLITNNLKSNTNMPAWDGSLSKKHSLHRSPSNAASIYIYTYRKRNLNSNRLNPKKKCVRHELVSQFLLDQMDFPYDVVHRRVLLIQTQRHIVLHLVLRQWKVVGCVVGMRCFVL